MSKDLVIVDGNLGDWSALYVNGKEYYQGHDIPLHILAEVVDNLKVYNESGESSYSETKGSFPENLKDIPKDILEKS